MSTLAGHVLQELRRSFGVTVGTVSYLDLRTGSETWLLSAHDARQSWAVHYEGEYYAAICELARLVGMDLEG